MSNHICFGEKVLVLPSPALISNVVSKNEVTLKSPDFAFMVSSYMLSKCDGHHSVNRVRFSAFLKKY